jgi:hypothetical protein
MKQWVKFTLSAHFAPVLAFREIILPTLNRNAAIPAPFAAG